MSRFISVIAACLFAGAASGAPFEASLRIAEEAHERCQSAWLQSRRQKAKEDINSAMSDMIATAPVPDAEKWGQLEKVHGYFEACARLINPDALLFD